MNQVKPKGIMLLLILTIAQLNRLRNRKEVTRFLIMTAVAPDFHYCETGPKETLRQSLIGHKPMRRQKRVLLVLTP